MPTLYGAFAATGCVTGVLWLERRRERLGLGENAFWAAVWIMLAGAVIGAKGLFVVLGWEHYARGELRFWQDFGVGFVFFGGLAGAALAGLAFARWRGLSFVRGADYFAVAVPMGHAIGRVGCFFAGCCGGHPPHPVQLYEAAGLALIAWAGSASLGRVEAGALAPGSAFRVYLVLYGMLRFVLDPLRADGRPERFLGISHQQGIALALIALGLAWPWLARALVFARGRRRVASRRRATLAAIAPCVALAAGVARAATLEGPVEGGTRGRPFTAATFDLAPHGYVEEEYFLSGEAATYGPAPGTTLGAQGRWTLVATERTPFETRILVRRPADAGSFRGMVLVEWLNVTGGWDIDAVWAQVHAEVLRSRALWVGVSAQRASVNGPPVLPGVSQPLTTWDAERYGTLEIRDDGLSYDVFTQAARLVGPERPRGRVDPLAGFAVERVLATGASQSAHRLASYVNGVHPLARVFDGFLILGRFGVGASLAPGVDVPRPLFVRRDLATPVFVVNTESEALASYPVRQPDSDFYRYWEIAGAAHQPTFVDQIIDAQLQRDLGLVLPPCSPPGNSMPAHRVTSAALRWLERWSAAAAPQPLLRGAGAAGGTRALRRARRAAPPRLPPIAIGGEPPEIERDRFGNALGGIRLPELEAPTAQYGPVGMPEELRCDLRGFTLPFDAATLAALYPDHRSYVRRFNGAVFRALRAGFLLPEDARDARREAEQAPVP